MKIKNSRSTATTHSWFCCLYARKYYYCAWYLLSGFVSSSFFFLSSNCHVIKAQSNLCARRTMITHTHTLDHPHPLSQDILIHHQSSFLHTLPPSLSPHVYYFVLHIHTVNNNLSFSQSSTKSLITRMLSRVFTSAIRPATRSSALR